MKLSKPKLITSNITLPCDLCGHKVMTVSVYLKAKSDRRILPGFYSDLGIHLCEDCIDEMKKLFTSKE